MQHRYKMALETTHRSAQKYDLVMFAVHDCEDGELYAVSLAQLRESYLEAEVFAQVFPDGHVILNPNFVETYQ